AARLPAPAGDRGAARARRSQPARPGRRADPPAHLSRLTRHPGHHGVTVAADVAWSGAAAAPWRWHARAARAGTGEVAGKLTPGGRRGWPGKPDRAWLPGQPPPARRSGQR